MIRGFSQWLIFSIADEEVEGVGDGNKDSGLPILAWYYINGTVISEEELH